jgi:hypothetical protein
MAGITGITGLLNGLLEVLGKVLDIAVVKKLREHSDEILKLEKELDALLSVSYDDMDDLAISRKRKELSRVRDAFFRDLSLGLAKK